MMLKPTPSPDRDNYKPVDLYLTPVANLDVTCSDIWESFSDRKVLSTITVEPSAVFVPNPS